MKKYVVDENSTLPIDEQVLTHLSLGYVDFVFPPAWGIAKIYNAVRHIQRYRFTPLNFPEYAGIGIRAQRDDSFVRTPTPPTSQEYSEVIEEDNSPYIPIFDDTPNESNDSQPAFDGFQGGESGGGGAQGSWSDSSSDSSDSSSDSGSSDGGGDSGGGE